MYQLDQWYNWLIGFARRHLPAVNRALRELHAGL